MNKKITLCHSPGLVVDDKENIRQITRAILEKFGCRVLTVTDGTDALAAYAEHRDRIALV